MKCRPKPPSTEFHDIIFNVIGVDQHGQEVNFDVYDLESAEWHQERFARLGGKVEIKKLKYNKGAAGWRELKEP